MRHVFKKTLAGCLFMVLAMSQGIWAVSAASPPTTTWQRTFGRPRAGDGGYAIRLTPDGGYLVLGATSTRDADGKRDLGKLWVFKLDAQGHQLWEQTFGGEHATSDDVETGANPGALVVGSHDEYLVTGETFENISTDEGWRSLATWTFKSTAQGTMLWEHFWWEDYDNPADPLAMEATLDGGVVVGGRSSWYEDETPQSDAWLIKLTADGDLEWTHVFGDKPVGEVNAIVVNPDGTYTVAGDTGHRYIWLLTLDSNRNVLWERHPGTPWFGRWWNIVTRNCYDVHALHATADGGYVLAGEREKYPTIPTEEYHTDAWIAKVDAEGHSVWERAYGHANVSEQANAVVSTQDGGYLIVGTKQPIEAWSDAWIVKIDADGNQLWEYTLGGPKNDSLTAIQATPDGGYIAVGTIWTKEGGHDAWVVKLDADGRVE